MKKAQVVVAISVPLVLTTLMATVQAGTIFRDTFADGDPQDGMPVTWVPDDDFPGVYEVRNGSYVLTDPANDLNGLASIVSEHLLQDTSIRAHIKLEDATGTGHSIDLGARLSSDAGLNSGYYVQVNQGGALAMYRWDSDETATVLAHDNSPNVPGAAPGIVLQFDVIGNHLSLWAWRADDKMPSAPLLTAVDSTYSEGLIGIGSQFGEAAGNSKAVFRYVHVADMHTPEPASLMLTLMGVFTASMFGSTRRYARQAR